MKKILFYALGVLLPVAVCLAVYSYEKPITDPTVMANIEALTDTDNDGKPVKGAISDAEGDICFVYIDGKQVSGRKSVCNEATVTTYCTSGICSVSSK